MDSEQIGIFYREHGPAILRYLRGLVGDVEAAQDLLQETFGAALRFPERLGKAGSARAWLFGVARMLGRNFLRRRRPTQSLTADLPDSVETKDPRLEQMRKSIKALPCVLRETLQLKLQQELTYQEISAVLGIPIGTVRSRLHHALRQLRSRLKVEGREE